MHKSELIQRLIPVQRNLRCGQKRGENMSKRFFSLGTHCWFFSLVFLILPACDEPPSVAEPTQTLLNTTSEPGSTEAAGDPREGAEVDESVPATADRLHPRDLGYFTPMTEECCTQPGAASECWMNDAENDGVLCDTNQDCDSGSCDLTKGRCTCDGNEECNDGVCVDGICGPSWCNGYLVCSCWGGCEWWTTDQSRTLHDVAASQDKYCCEGVYARDPVDIDPTLGGFFSDTPCTGCKVDEDCSDNNPCTTDRCVDDVCTYVKLTGTQDTIPDAAQCPFNYLLYADDCARASCTNGSCTVESDWHAGQSCSGTPDEVPDDAHPDCYSRQCNADGTCDVIVNAGASCNVGVNNCSDATCDFQAVCQDAPLDAAGLAANPSCCDPAVPTSEDDGHDCTDDYCCVNGSGGPGCLAIPTYTQRNIPNFDPASPGDCCMESAQCSDTNDCTDNICCNSTNAHLAACGGDATDASWECAVAATDVPGCCDDAPANLADNCDDLFPCTDNQCCTPAAIAAAASDDPCFGATDYHCAAPSVFDPLPSGCCDPGGAGVTDCEDGNVCTAMSCNGSTNACDAEPLPDVAGCCSSLQPCDNEDANACTVENCCSPQDISNASVGEICFGANPWQCVISISGVPGCCTDASDCDDGNPCTHDSCVSNICQWGPLSDLSAVAGLCCDTPGDGVAQCADAADPGGCTQNVCCSPAMIAGAVAGDACFAADDWNCQNPVVNPVPQGCCDGVDYETDCNPGGDSCADVSCVNHNCEWAVVTPAPGNECCTADIDCPVADATNPCLASSSCSQSDNPIINPDWGRCDLSFRAQGTSCGTGDDCFDNVCGDPSLENLGCTVTTYAVAGTSCTPSGSAPACGDYECDGSGNCANLVAVSGGQPNETCANLIALGDASGGISETGSNECAEDTYEPESTGIFAECSGETYGDVVYAYTTTVDDSYALKHSVVTVTDPDGDWDPVVYTRTACTTGSTQNRCNDDCTFAGTNYNSLDYGVAVSGTCSGTESTVVAGPLAVEDVASHNATSPVAVTSQDFDRNSIRDGYDVIRSHTTSVIVDSQYSLPNTGGNFDLTIEEEAHNNNDCREIGSYAGAPAIDGNFTWKQRWRGTMSAGAYDNYFGGGDPHQAFFKLEIPAGLGKYLAYVDWNAMSRRGEQGNVINMDAQTGSASFFHATLSRLWADSVNSQDCSTVDMLTVSDASGLPLQLHIDASDATYANAWLAVGNQNAGEFGDYELTILRLQPDFFGFFDSYGNYVSAYTSGDFSPMSRFYGDGRRLDFVPSGTTDNGYVMTISDIGSGPDTCPDKSGGTDGLWDQGWLVHPFCYGNFGNNRDALAYALYADTFEEIVALPFDFPLGGDTYPFAYVDTTGRISLLKPVDENVTCANDSQCGSVGDCGSVARGCVCTRNLAYKTCVYNPGGVDYTPNAEEMFSPPGFGGYAPVVAGAWGAFRHRWSNGTRGYATLQTVVFEGTTAFVASWIGMEIYSNSPYTTSFPSNSNWNHYDAKPSWQVILRADGRMAFYYRPDSIYGWPIWDLTAYWGYFWTGISGGMSELPCSTDTYCQSNYFSDAKCDNSSPSAYFGTGKCFREIQPLIQNSNGIGNE